MREPDESGTESWMGNYTINTFEPDGSTGDGQVEAHLLSMQQFAAALKGNVVKNYDTRLPAVQQDMMTILPPVHSAFFELYNFLGVHNQAQNISQQNVFLYSQGTADFADAAHQVSQDYGNSDVFARAKVSDVDVALGTAEGDSGGGLS